MFKKLVKLDKNNGWRFTEVDKILLLRSAVALREFFDELPARADPYEVREQLAPYYMGAIDGTMQFPVRFSDLPLHYVLSENLLSPELQHVISVFYVTAAGCHLETPDEVLVDGERYAYMTFEEPGDWPERVQLEAERRKKARAAEFP
ncbi:MAG TPA: hypothetical protein VIT92_00430 [Burkholderiaceae bacterium]